MAASTLASLHVKARTPEYLGGIKRAVVPDDKVPWSVPWNEYNPVDYTASVVLKGPAWADPDIRSAITDIFKIYNSVTGSPRAQLSNSTKRTEK